MDIKEKYVADFKIEQKPNIYWMVNPNGRGPRLSEVYNGGLLKSKFIAEKSIISCYYSITPSLGIYFRVQGYIACTMTGL